VQLIRDGVIGKVTAVHSWQRNAGNGYTKLIAPPAPGPVPEGLAWDLWLGTAQFREYAPDVYHPFKWRDWIAFGAGTMGDFGCHILDPVFTALGLGAPLTITADNEGINAHTWPSAETVRYVFPGTPQTAGPTLPVKWYDGGRLPDVALAQLPPEQLGQMAAAPVPGALAQPVRVALMGAALARRLGAGGRELLALDIVAQFQQLEQKNIRTALSALALMERFYGLNMPEKAIRKGMRDTSKQTGLKGRWQVLGKRPMIIADTGHNEAGIKEILTMLKKQSFNQLHWVFGAVNDKDIGTILKILPKKAHYIFCQANIPRALDAIVLQEMALGYGLHGEVVRNVKKALKEALSKANRDDLILVGGSTFVVGDVL
jgi:hypothetical protein